MAVLDEVLGGWQGRASPHGTWQKSRAVQQRCRHGDFSPIPNLAASGTRTTMVVVEALHPFTPCLQPEELPAHQKPIWIEKWGTKYSH